MTAPTRKNVLVFGATGTAGSGAVRGLLRAGHSVTCLVRKGADPVNGVTLITGDATDAEAVTTALAHGPFDAVVSCLASRSGAPDDAWRIDHDAHVTILDAAKAAKVPHVVVVSAICVQRPLLEFQRAKLAFEAKLITSGLKYSIVRPTAFFKSLSGQAERLRKGKPFLIFGDGTLTACKPISDDDLGDFIATCLTDPSKQNTILPIGGPGPALTAKEQGALLAHALGVEPKFKSVPIRLMDAIIATLSGLGRVSAKMKAKSELARIGRYYATESMLVWDAETQRYDADQTPEFGTQTLASFYEELAQAPDAVRLGDHAVF